MGKVEMIMPKMGESIMEATVLTWLKKEGDTIEQDESVLEVATDKVDTEVPATYAGVLTQILAQEGDVVPVGSAIAIITTSGNEELLTNGVEKIQEPDLAEAAVVAEAVVLTGSVIETSSPTLTQDPIPGRFYSPLVLNIARQEQIPMTELETIPGSGKEGRVTKKDILNHLENRNGGAVTLAEPAVQPSQPVVSTPAPVTATAPKTPVLISGDDEIIEMDRMRKMIAGRMIESTHTSAHVTSFVEADVTNIVNWRNKHKDEFQAKTGEKLTFTPIFMEAVAQAIKDFPMINISVDGDNIIKKKHINIGMAVALPSGNLIVPVVHDADQYNLSGLASKVNDLANRARNNKLMPDELSGGTYSISNVGTFGNVMGTPIIMQPQVAILAIGAIVKKPAVVETPEGDMIGIRHKMFLSHSYDHRVVDGALGGMVVRKIADYLEEFDVNRAI